MKNLEIIKRNIENEMMSDLLKLNYVDTIIYKHGFDVFKEFLNLSGDIHLEIEELYEKYNNNVFIRNKDNFWFKRINKYLYNYFMDYETKKNKCRIIVNIFNDIVDNWLRERWDYEKERVLEMTLIDDVINEYRFITTEMSKVSKKKINSILNNLNKNNMDNGFEKLIKKKMLDILIGLNEFETKKYKIGCDLYKKVRDNNFVLDDEDWYLENGFKEEYIWWNNFIKNTLQIFVDTIIFSESQLIKIYDEVIDEWNKNILMREEEGYYWNEVKGKWIKKE